LWCAIVALVCTKMVGHPVLVWVKSDGVGEILGDLTWSPLPNADLTTLANNAPKPLCGNEQRPTQQVSAW